MHLIFSDSELDLCPVTTPADEDNRLNYLPVDVCDLAFPRLPFELNSNGILPSHRQSELKQIQLFNIAVKSKSRRSKFVRLS
jgi:hypothetical protein